MLPVKACFHVTMVLLLYGAAPRQVECASSEVHLKLLDDLLCNYTRPFMRPVNETTKTVTVRLRFTPVFSTLDETKEELKVRAMLALVWKDYRLKWEPADYDDINETNVPLSENDKQNFWIPELSLYECLVTDFHSFYPETTSVTLSYTGEIHWYTLATTKSYCPVENMHFPLDVQSCNLTFTTWVYQTNEQIFLEIDDLVENDTYKKYELKNALWNVNIRKVEVGMDTYDCETCKGEKQSYVRYSLQLTRGQPFWLVLIFVLPSIVISILLLSVPSLPQKVDVDAPSYALTCVLTLFVYLTFLYSNLPATGPAFIGIYMIFMIVGGIIAVCYAVNITRDAHADMNDNAIAGQRYGSITDTPNTASNPDGNQGGGNDCEPNSMEMTQREEGNKDYLPILGYEASRSNVKTRICGQVLYVCQAVMILIILVWLVVATAIYCKASK